MKAKMPTSPGLSWLKAAQADLPYADEINALTRTGFLILFTCVLSVGIWMGFAPLSGAVVALGTVKVDLNRKTVQHQEGGIVKTIRVRDGDHVAAGDILIELDDVRVDAELALIDKRLDAERASYARLSAETTLSPNLSFPPELLTRSTHPNVREILNRERILFSTRRTALVNQSDLLRKQIQQAVAEADALGKQIAAEERAVLLQKDELLSNQELLRKNFVQRTRVLSLDRAVADYESRLGEHKAELAKAQQRATELELRILSLKNSYTQNAADGMRESNGRLLELEERMRPSRDAVVRQRILAPQAGTIVDQRITTLGSVIGPREPLMDIVPSDGQLIVEGRIKTDEINYVRVGTRVDVRLTAYKERTTPMVEGRVSYVSADKLVDRASNIAYFEFHVEITKEALKNAGDLKIQSGMPAELFVSTGERTVLDYLLDPFTAYARRAFREP